MDPVTIGLIASAAISAGSAIYGSVSGSTARKKARSERKAMQAQILDMIGKQEQEATGVYAASGQALESEYDRLYGQTMGDTYSDLAGAGILGSPVAEKQLERKRQALMDTFATSKAKLEGAYASQLSDIDRQRINYQLNVNQAAYADKMAELSARSELVSGIGGAVGSIAAAGRKK